MPPIGSGQFNSSRLILQSPRPLLSTHCQRDKIGIGERDINIRPTEERGRKSGGGEAGITDRRPLYLGQSAYAAAAEGDKCTLGKHCGKGGEIPQHTGCTHRARKVLVRVTTRSCHVCPSLPLSCSPDVRRRGGNGAHIDGKCEPGHQSQPRLDNSRGAVATWMLAQAGTADVAKTPITHERRRWRASKRSRTRSE